MRILKNENFQEYGGRNLRVNFSDKPKPREPLYPETEFKLFVGNLSWTVNSESLTDVFSNYGNVVGARVLYDGETGRSRGYGFVCFSSKSEMEAALESLNGVVSFPSSSSFIFLILVVQLLIGQAPFCFRQGIEFGRATKKAYTTKTEEGLRNISISPIDFILLVTMDCNLFLFP